MPEIPGLAVEHSFHEVRGLRMHVAAAGPADAEPLVMVHGWPQHWYAWRRLIGPLSERYRVICPDLRGFGWTDAPRGSYLKAELAADVVGLLDVLGLERVRLAGHDWGGFVGFLLCLDHPRRVSHFAVAGMSHLWVRRETGVERRRQPAAPARLHGPDRLTGPRRSGRPPASRLHPHRLPVQRRRSRPDLDGGRAGELRRRSGASPTGLPPALPSTGPF